MNLHPLSLPAVIALALSSFAVAVNPPTEIDAPVGLTLDDALARADRTHPDLVGARADVEAAAARIRQAGALPNPNAVARIESAPFEGGTAGEAEYVAGLSQPIPLGNRRSTARKVEELDLARLNRQLDLKRREIHQRVRSAFASALYLEAVTQTHARTESHARRLRDLTRLRLEQGDAASDELARAELEHLRADADLRNARSLHAQALPALSAAIGDPAAPISSVQGALEEALALTDLEQIADDRSHHAAAAAAEAEVEVQRARVDLARAERIPIVNLDLFYRRLQSEERDAFDAGFSLPLPLFQHNSTRVRERTAQLTAAEARARRTRTDLELQFSAARASLHRALASARQLKDELLPRADTLQRAAEARLAVGEASLADVLPIHRDVAALRLDYYETLRDVMAAWAELQPHLVTSEAGGSRPASMN